MRARARGLTALAYLGCALIWSTTWFAIRVCIEPGGYPTLAGAAIRFVVAVTVLGAAAILKCAGVRPPANPLRLTARGNFLPLAGSFSGPCPGGAVKKIPWGDLALWLPALFLVYVFAQ